MKLSKFDIGAEVISILTKGMYQDPRDALREYVQNGIDAGADSISIKVRQNSVVIIDNGTGMDYSTLRKAVRVGISDKDPKKKVGFMGIGIYSSFHLCDKLVIFSHKENNTPLRLEIDFLSMRNTLEEQRQSRLEENISADELIDLQTLLENCISLTDDDALTNEDFPTIGTRVELVGLEGNFLNLVSDFSILSNYLREVVPLHFDRNKFLWAEKVENEIQDICRKNNATFQLINLSLQVNSIFANLYRPYENSDFSNDTPNEPIFKEMVKDTIFLGVTWACLNSDRKKIQKKELRGFLLKKQGFAIGNRDKIALYFKQRTHFDRYIGEIIVTNPKILPNASRSDLEYSQYSTMFFEILANDIATFYNRKSNIYQEQTLADTQISEFKTFLNKLNLEYKRDEKDTKVLVRYIVDVNSELQKIIGKENDASLTELQKKDIKTLVNSAKTFIEQIQESINNLSKTANREGNRKKPKSKSRENAQLSIAKKLSNVQSVKTDIPNYENLFDLLKDLDIELSDEVKFILEIIDERFIQGYAHSRQEYYDMMMDLRNTIIENLN
jgi:molecular chaperone HtpG